jgi:hypothetical protein
VSAKISNKYIPIPFEITSLRTKGVTDVHAGRFCSFAIIDKCIYAWGNNYCKCCAFAHHIDGQLAADVKEIGDVAEPMLIESMTRVEKIATGGSFTLCLTEDRQVYSWGVGSDLLTGSTEAHVPHVVNELNGRFVQDIICGETFSYAMLV